MFVKACRSDEIRVVDQADQKKFRTAIEKEVKSTIHTNKAMRPLGIEQGNWVRKNRADRIVCSRFHLRKKPMDKEELTKSNAEQEEPGKDKDPVTGQKEIKWQETESELEGPERPEQKGN